MQVHVVEVIGGPGGRVQQADWDWAAQSRHVRCGLDDIVHDDLSDRVLEGGDPGSWEAPVTDRDGRCGDDYESALFRLANCERTRRSLAPLECDLRLVSLGRRHSRDMRERRYFSHLSPEGATPFDRLESTGVAFSSAAENLALAPTVAHAHRGWMDSPGHRENLLSETSSYSGVGVVAGEQGFYFTALFMTPPR
ncbi:CAP domain-containing protein [Lujinxingia litoralis]|uniref:CAP domain-containing protein n=1 Tax=Lujinxingia litoralis TaxID=2211119 RepID=UPI0013147EC2|nr:CAP domain-containing protein [Lujinxingia litoralis]